MKNKLLLLSVCVMLLTAGCGTTKEAQTQTPIADNSQQAESTAKTNNSGTKSERVSENFVTYTDSIGTPHILYLGVVQNTDTKPLQYGGVTIDVNDDNGNLIKHLDMGIVYPDYLMPGEKGYICEDCAQLDDTIDLTKVAKTEMHYGTRAATNYKKPNVEITQLELKTNQLGPNVIGKVKSNEDIEDLWIAFPICDSNGNLQTVAITNVGNISNGDERGFECTPMEYDPNIDFSASKVEALPYVSLF